MLTDTLPAGWRIITAENRDEWLAGRVKTLGASECAAALGLDPHCTPIEVWAMKLGRLERQEPGEAAYWGLALEDDLLDRYSEDGPGIALKQVHAVSAEHPFLSATVDAIDDSGDLIETKTINERGAAVLGDSGSDEVLDRWRIQSQIQMHVFDRALVRYPVLIAGQKYREFVVERDTRLFAAMLPKLQRFWKCVQTGEEPDWNAESLPDPRVLSALYDPTEEAFEPDADLVVLFDEYARLGAELSELGKSRDAIKSQLLMALKGRTATFPDGRVARLKRIEVKGYLVEPRVEARLSVTKPKESR
jgi:putative phage-type endonuclease